MIVERRAERDCAAYTIQFYFWPRSSAGRKAVADAKRETARRRDAHLQAAGAAFQDSAKHFYISESKRLWDAHVASVKSKPSNKKKKGLTRDEDPVMPHCFQASPFFNYYMTATIAYFIFPCMQPMADFSTHQMDSLKFAMLGNLAFIEDTYRHAMYSSGYGIRPIGFMYFATIKLAPMARKLARGYLDVIQNSILTTTTSLLNGRKNITAFVRVLNVWLRGTSMRLESGKGALLSPWAFCKEFPDEFRELFDTWEEGIMELTEQDGFPTPDEIDNNYGNGEMDDDDDDESDSDTDTDEDGPCPPCPRGWHPRDDEPRPLPVPMPDPDPGPHNNQSSASCTA